MCSQSLFITGSNLTPINDHNHKQLFNQHIENTINTPNVRMSKMGKEMFARYPQEQQRKSAINLEISSSQFK